MPPFGSKLRFFGLSRPSHLALRCPTCGRSAPQPQGFRAACGGSLFLPDSPRDAAPLPREDSPPRSAGRVARIALGVGALIAFAWILGTPAPRAVMGPSLAGVRLGDDPPCVRHQLGSPAGRPSKVFWNDDRGTPHRVELWRYGLDSKGDGQVANLTITFLDDRVFQIGALDREYVTSEGLKVGDRLARARQLYGTPIEEDRIAGLVPLKFLSGTTVVKVVVMPGRDEVLAVGLESPRTLPLPSDHSEHSLRAIPRSIPRHAL